MIHTQPPFIVGRALVTTRGVFREHDQVIVSGYCTTEQRYYHRLRAVVATISSRREVKVWPVSGDGKLWFDPFFAQLEIPR